MQVKERLEGLARISARRPSSRSRSSSRWRSPARCMSLGLKPSTGIDTYVSKSSATFQATDRDHRDFGGDAVIILIKEPLTSLVETKDLANVTFLEACLAGQYVVPSQQLQSFQPAPPGAHAPYGGWQSPCGKLMRTKPVQVVYGPGTFLNRAVAAVNTETRALLQSAQQAVQNSCNAAYKLAIGRGLTREQATNACKAASSLEQQRQLQNLERLYLNSGINGTPRIDDPQFIPQIVFDQTSGRQSAEVPVRVPVPDRELGAHPGPAQGEPERTPSRPRRSAGSARRCACRCSARPTAGSTR